MYNLQQEAFELATEAARECHFVYDDALDYLHESIDGCEIVIYYHRAINFCADVDTSAGEEWLEDCGGISHEGDTFGKIACRIAYATLFVRASEMLHSCCEQSHTDRGGFGVDG